jgi:hypothetical protein
MGYIEDLRDKRQGAGRLRYRVRYRDPAGRERAKSFARRWMLSGSCGTSRLIWFEVSGWTRSMAG